ncbi:MAG TPA: PQQ-dependent sugar dehydrogenase [Candidatus Binatia bacterium]|jgi:glucose/arabinose dehydrogenase
MARTLRKNLALWPLAVALLSAQAVAGESKPDVPVEVVANGLQVPWAIAFAPESRIFLTERPGRVRVIKDGALQKEPWLQIEVYAHGEAGLLGLALDPGFERNRFLYAAYTYRDGSAKPKNRLVRLRDDPSTGKGAVDKILLDNVDGGNNHDGGRVKFGPDGKIYWTTGDAQTTRFAQELSSLNGKILRLNSDGTIPADNPFAKSPIYSYGHRNSEGLAWQPGSGRLYATEHGPSGFQGCCLDEINWIEPGKNYGWPDARGDQAREGTVPPVLHSGTSDTWAPAGATFVTRGLWAGSFLFTGLRGQTLYRVAFDANNPRKVAAVERLFPREFGRLRDVAEGPDGAIYLLTSNRDGRGKPAADDDRVLRLLFK